MDVTSFEDQRFFDIYGRNLPHVGQAMHPADIRGFSHTHHPSAQRMEMRRTVGRTRVNTAVAGAMVSGCCAPCNAGAPCGPQVAYDPEGRFINQTMMIRMTQYSPQWPNSLSYTGYPARWW